MSGDITAKEKSSQNPPKSEALGCFVRVLWMGAGNIGILYCLFALARDAKIKFSFSWIDAVFWGVVIVMIVARYIDITRLDGRTTSNQPATMKHLWRYVIMLLGIGLLGWIGAHMISYYALI